MTELITVVDAVGRGVSLPVLPQRIVSICPSQTELLFDLGLADRVVGITQWCVHPAEGVKDVVKVGGTKKVNLRKVAALRPDLIICEKEENTKEMVDALAQVAPVFVTNVESITDALAMIETVGRLTGTASTAQELSARIRQELDTVQRGCPPLRTAYLIWKEPWMAAGSTTYIDSVLAHLGLQNCMQQEGSRYPAFGLELLAAKQPELILLSSEPYAFTEQHATELAQLFPRARVMAVDGEMFSWYGSRMLLASAYLKAFCLSLQQSA